MTLKEHGDLIEVHTPTKGIEETHHSSIPQVDPPQNSSNPYTNQLVRTRLIAHEEVRE